MVTPAEVTRVLRDLEENQYLRTHGLDDRARTQLLMRNLKDSASKDVWGDAR